jgi:hypothetical protein
MIQHSFGLVFWTPDSNPGRISQVFDVPRAANLHGHYDR